MSGQSTPKERPPLKGRFRLGHFPTGPWAVGVHAEPVSTSLLVTIDGERSQGSRPPRPSETSHPSFADLPLEDWAVHSGLVVVLLM